MKAISTSEHKKRGTERPDRHDGRLENIDFSTDITQDFKIEVPKSLTNKVAKKVWVDTLEEVRLSRGFKTIDLTAIEMYAYWVGEHHKYRDESPVHIDKDGNMKNNYKWAACERAFKSAWAIGQEYGFTLKSRTMIKLPDVKEEKPDDGDFQL